jgi:hypothetical protein
MTPESTSAVPDETRAGILLRDEALNLHEDRHGDIHTELRRRLVQVALDKVKRGEEPLITIDDAADIDLGGRTPKLRGPTFAALLRLGVVYEVGAVKSRRAIAHARKITQYKLVDADAGRRYLIQTDPRTPSPRRPLTKFKSRKARASLVPDGLVFDGVDLPPGASGLC